MVTLCMLFKQLQAECLVYVTAISHNRAVGAGPAGPAAAGPIFGQLTRAKIPYELW